MLKKTFNLSDKGAKDLTKAVIACTVTDLAMMLPFFVIIQFIATLLMPVFGIGDINTGRLWGLFLLGAASAVIYWAVYRVEYDKTYKAAYEEAENTRISLAEHMRKLPMSFFSRKDISELSSNLMKDCATVEHTISHLLPQICGHAIAISIVCIMIAFYDWRMALAIYCTLPAAAAVVVLSRKVQSRVSRSLVKTQLEASNLVQEYLEGIKVIKAFGLGGAKSEKLERTFNTLKNKSIKLEVVVGAFVTSAVLILQSALGITIFAGIYFMSQGTLAIIPFIAFVIIAVRIYSPLIVVMQLLGELFHMIISTERMQAMRTVPQMCGDTDFTPINSDISIYNATFAYNDKAVINDINIKIDSSSIVALVGPSGSGKSTLTRLIARFWDVCGGEITFGGRNISEIDPEELMKHMSFVFQDVVLFNDTVYNNIAIGKPGATYEEVVAAAKTACCDSFIRRMPDGYDSIIGENGCTLSGGERQRISIARAVLKNAPVLLLDEATASLDPESETAVQRALSELVRDKTVIMIAHRLRTVAGVDKIIVLDEGRVAGSGTHEELLQANGLYAKLYNTQQQSAGWTF